MIRSLLWFLFSWWVTDPWTKKVLGWVDVGLVIGTLTTLLGVKWLHMLRRRRAQLERGESVKSLWLPIVMTVLLTLMMVGLVVLEVLVGIHRG